MNFTDVYISNGFLYTEDEHAYLIIELATGKIIRNQYKKIKYLTCETCYVFCGRTNGNPEIYDINNHDYISSINGE